MNRMAVVLSLIVLTIFSACALVRSEVAATDSAQVPGTNFQTFIPTNEEPPVTQLSPQATLPPIPTQSLPVIYTSQKVYQDSNLGIQLTYPDIWYLQENQIGDPTGIVITSFAPANPPHKLEWTDQTIRMEIRRLPAGSVPRTIDAWVQSARQAAAAMQLTVFEEDRLLIADQPAARLTLVSGSGGIIHKILMILNEQNYEIDIEGNFVLGESVLNTLQQYTSSGIKPSEGDSPAAGICSETQDPEVAIVLGLDLSGIPLAGRCVVLFPTQRIKLINQSGGIYDLLFAGYDLDIPAGHELLLDAPVGAYLATGIHLLPMGPTLWVKGEEINTPIPTLPGALQSYSNLEVGYALSLPPGWHVDEYGMAMPNKEVLIYPDNAEPFETYLSISLDPRTVDQVMNSFAVNVPEAAREDTILSGLPVVKYTFPYSRQEYYVPFEDRVILIASDRPMDGNVQLILMSIRFVSTTPVP